MVERIIELADILKNNTGDVNASCEELKDIIVPKVIKINKLLKKVGLKDDCIDITGFDGKIIIENDTNWGGSSLNNKSIILQCYDKDLDDFSYKYVYLDYFNKSDDELFEAFKEKSITIRTRMVEFVKDRIKDEEKRMLKLNIEIENIKNLQL